jgi:site-specific DNA-methyltransferase (adenine-specific)
MDLPINQIICGDCLEVMKGLPDKCIDLTVTSPPYDNLRTYNGFTFDFEGIAKELYRVTKKGGVVVWVVGDATINGSETGTSFRQALYFKEIGFNLHDTMIYAKNNVYAHDPRNKRYKQCFEYMFVLSKGKPNTYNEIKDRPNKHVGKTLSGTKGRTKEGIKRNLKPIVLGEYQARFNIWEYTTGGSVASDKIAFNHPAIFPEKLAEDHIISWSNEGDIVLDPFLGSGTTAKMALLNGRNYIGIDISEEYCEIARKRIAEHTQQLSIV